MSFVFFFFNMQVSQGGKLLVMLLLDILIASVSAGLWTAWKSSLQRTEPHPGTFLSRHWVRWPWQKCLSSCQDGWAHWAAFIWEYQESNSHAGCRKVFLGNRGLLSPFYRLKAETKKKIVYLFNLRQSKKPVGGPGSTLGSQPQTDGQASSTTALSLWAFSNGEA